MHQELKEIFNQSGLEIYSQILDVLESALYRICITDTENAHAVESVTYQIEHGTKHMQTVRKNMEVLLRATIRNGKDWLEPHEIFIAMASASFHDIGLHFGWGLHNPSFGKPLSLEQAKDVRINHGRIGALWIQALKKSEIPGEVRDKLNPQQLGILKDETINAWLAFLVEHHQTNLSQEKIEEILLRAFPSKTHQDVGEKLPFLLCLLQIADVLDMGGHRVSAERMHQGINHLIHNDITVIRPLVEDVKRFLMVHYVQNAEMSINEGNGQVEFKLRLGMPTSMLGEDFSNLRNYLRDKYNKRLNDDGRFHRNILEKYAEIHLRHIDISAFTVCPHCYELSVGALKKIFDIVAIFPSEGRTESEKGSDNLQLNLGTVPNKLSYFINRQHALDHLEEALEETGRVVQVTGQVGVGKKTLVAEFLRERRPGWRVLWHDCPTDSDIKSLLRRLVDSDVVLHQPIYDFARLLQRNFGVIDTVLVLNNAHHLKAGVFRGLWNDVFKPAGKLRLILLNTQPTHYGPTSLSTVPVEPMDEVQAKKLVRSLSQKMVIAHLNVDEEAQVIQQAGGLPLMIWYYLMIKKVEEHEATFKKQLLTNSLETGNFSERMEAAITRQDWRQAAGFCVRLLDDKPNDPHLIGIMANLLSADKRLFSAYHFHSRYLELLPSEEGTETRLHSINEQLKLIRGSFRPTPIMDLIPEHLRARIQSHLNK